MKLYSYVITHDTGFSPNPFWGWCTLADCKPAIRRNARPGDWIVGLSPKRTGNRIVYVMRVEEVLPFSQYFGDPRFRSKIPDFEQSSVVFKCGDNIYMPLSDGCFRQLRSSHSNGLNENPESKARDLKGKNVLVSRTFWYFGRNAIPLPAQLEELKVGRAHKCHFPKETIDEFLAFIRRCPIGVNARPASWPERDESWRTTKQ